MIYKVEFHPESSKKFTENQSKISVNLHKCMADQLPVEYFDLTGILVDHL